MLGHSLGGAVGLALASDRFAVPVQAVIGLGIKVVWADEELQRARAAAQRPRPGTARATRQPHATCACPAWLACCPPMTQPWTRGCVSRTGSGGWRWTRARFAVGAPDMAELLARSQAPVTLARGENDPMNTDEQLARLGAPTVTLPGLGHNAHVESPELSITLLGQWAS